MMIPAIANKFALLWGFCDIWPGGHLYGSRLGNCKQVCIALGFCDIWPGGHLYGCASAIANKFALLSASAYICVSAMRSSTM